MEAAKSIADIAKILSEYRMSVGTEEALQNSIDQILTLHNIHHLREYRLGRGPVDFFLPSGAIAIEAKINGSPSAVVKQVLDYMDDDRIQGMILVTRRKGLDVIPSEVLGKPVIGVWVGGLNL